MVCCHRWAGLLGTLTSFKGISISLLASRQSDMQNKFDDLVLEFKKDWLKINTSKTKNLRLNPFWYNISLKFSDNVIVKLYWTRKHNFNFNFFFHQVERKIRKCGKCTYFPALTGNLTQDDLEVSAVHHPTKFGAKLLCGIHKTAEHMADQRQRWRRFQDICEIMQKTTFVGILSSWVICSLQES